MPPRLWIPRHTTITTTQQKQQQHLTTTLRRREALSLYREILRTAKHFHWADVETTGQPWNVRLRQQARKEFDESRHENRSTGTGAIVSDGTGLSATSTKQI